MVGIHRKAAEVAKQFFDELFSLRSLRPCGVNIFGRSLTFPLTEASHFIYFTLT